MKSSVETDTWYQSDERMYEPLWHIVQLVSSLAVAQISISEGKLRPAFRMMYHSPLFKNFIALPVGGVVADSIDNIRPEFIQIVTGISVPKLPPPPRNHDPERTNLGEINSLICSIVFANFYELHLDFIMQRWGVEATKWPSLVNFARVVRNAIAHRGKLKFKGPNSPSAQWHSLKFFPADEGRKIIGKEIRL